MGIPTTFWDDNPEDRRFIVDFWTWLKDQPQQAWLYFARRANWDQADLMFVDMVRDPRCDRALASWLFWSADPAWLIRNGKRPDGDSLIGAILARSASGGFPAGGLHYQRVEVALNALDTAAALEQTPGIKPFRIPRELCANFEGDNPDLPTFDAETERDLQTMFEYLDGGGLPRTDRESIEWNRKGGNWWFEPALRLPPEPVVTAEMSDVEAIDAVFGDHRSSLQRIEQARQASRKSAAPAVRPPATSATNRFGMTTDPKQRLIGLLLLGGSSALLLLLLWNWFAS